MKCITDQSPLVVDNSDVRCMTPIHLEFGSDAKRDETKFTVRIVCARCGERRTEVRTEVSAGRHTFVIDEHANMGGADAGPSPLEYLLGSLAGCEEVIAQLVTREMEFQLNGIQLEIEGRLDVRGLMGTPNVQPYFQSVRIRAKGGRGDERQAGKSLTFDDAGTTWVKEFKNPDNKYFDVYKHAESLGIIAGACEYCAHAFGVVEQVKEGKVPLFGEAGGHPINEGNLEQSLIGVQTEAQLRNLLL